MKTYAIEQSSTGFAQKVFVSILMLAIISMSQNVYGASSSPTPNRSADEIRKEANVFFTKGETYQKQENYQEAEVQYRRAIKIDTKYAEAYSNLGYSLRKQGAYRKAVKYYKKAIKLNPQLAEAHEYLGEAYAELGQIDKAIKELKILRELDPEEADELEAFINKKNNG